MNYEKLILFCYKKYQEDWCAERGYHLSECDPKIGFHGECFVSLSEFEKNEFQNEEYMESLLTHRVFIAWKSRAEYKKIMTEHRICMRYTDQIMGRQFPCPRCGGEMDPHRSHNALSRRIDVYVCSLCGTKEALEDAPFAHLPKVPISDWFIAKLEEGK